MNNQRCRVLGCWDWVLFQDRLQNYFTGRSHKTVDKSWKQISYHWTSFLGFQKGLHWNGSCNIYNCFKIWETALEGVLYNNRDQRYWEMSNTDHSKRWRFQTISFNFLLQHGMYNLYTQQKPKVLPGDTNYRYLLFDEFNNIWRMELKDFLQKGKTT